jgi:hypothetical protein
LKNITITNNNNHRPSERTEGVDPELVAEAKAWEAGYAEYLKTIPKGSDEYKHFYGWMYTEVYRKVRKEAGWD